MKTIYIVTAGDYSDYHICAVFETEELANQYVAAFKTPHEFVINSYVLNDTAPDNGLLAYWVRMARDGSVDVVEQRDCDYGFKLGAANAEISKCWDQTDRIKKMIQVYCFAKDEEHAIKIAGEKRRQAIANGEWE